MDLQEIIHTHLRVGADLTVSMTLGKSAEASSLGIMQVDASGRVQKFVEKPDDEKTLSAFAQHVEDREHFLASMGIYVFNRKVLESLLEENPQSDFGKHIIPEAIHTYHVQSHIFNGYWEDIGNIKSFWAANLALTEPVLIFLFMTWSVSFIRACGICPPLRLIHVI